MSILDSLLGGAGYLLDTPGALTRGAIGNVADLLEGKDRVGARVGGRELLERLGLAGPNEEGWVPDMGDVAGLGVDVATDPLTYLLPGLTSAVKGAAKAAVPKAAGAFASATSGIRNPAVRLARVGARMAESGTPARQAAYAKAAGKFGKAVKRTAPFKYGRAGSVLGKEFVEKNVAPTYSKVAAKVMPAAAPGAAPRISMLRRLGNRLPAMEDVVSGVRAGVDPVIGAARYASKLPGSNLAALQVAKALGRGDDEGVDFSEPSISTTEVEQPVSRQQRALRDLAEGVQTMSYDEPDVGMVSIRRKRPPSRAELARRLMAQLELSNGRM